MDHDKLFVFHDGFILELNYRTDRISHLLLWFSVCLSTFEVATSWDFIRKRKLEWNGVITRLQWCFKGMTNSCEIKVSLGILCLVWAMVSVLPVTCFFFTLYLDLHIFGIHHFVGTKVDFPIDDVSSIVKRSVCLDVKITAVEFGTAVD
jgi:hypothetical protein